MAEGAGAEQRERELTAALGRGVDAGPDGRAHQSASSTRTAPPPATRPASAAAAAVQPASEGGGERILSGGIAELLAAAEVSRCCTNIISVTERIL